MRIAEPTTQRARPAPATTAAKRPTSSTGAALYGERSCPGTHDPRTDALLDPATYADADGSASRVRRTLRSTDGLAWNATAGFWAVARHADVGAASTDPGRFCSSRGILVEEIGRSYDSPADDDAHRSAGPHPVPVPRVPRLPPAGGARRSSRRSRRSPPSSSTRCPSASASTSSQALAVPFPIRVIVSLLGLSRDDEQRVWRWSEAAIPGATDWSDDERMALLGEMTVELLGLAAARRAEPRDDVVSMLAEVEVDGERLSDDELGMFLIQLLVAGNETTRHAVSGGIVALADASGAVGPPGRPTGRSCRPPSRRSCAGPRR